MEKRRSERVQFFQARTEAGILPVWVFRHGSPNSILGLLIDISPEGLQVLTRQEDAVINDLSQLTLYKAGSADHRYMNVLVEHRWSESEGSVYRRSGFAFEDATEVGPVLAEIAAARAAGETWLRCELLPLTTD